MPLPVPETEGDVTVLLPPARDPPSAGPAGWTRRGRLSTAMDGRHLQSPAALSHRSPATAPARSGSQNLRARATAASRSTVGAVGESPASRAYAARHEAGGSASSVGIACVPRASKVA